MNYRHHKGMRFEQLLWITKKPAKDRIGFLSNKYTPSRKSRGFTHVLALELLRLSM